MNYTRKRLVVIPIERNCQRIIEQRTEFCKYVEHISGDNWIYLDEFTAFVFMRIPSEIARQ